MPKRRGFLDRIIDRLDSLDPSNVQSSILRLVRERGFFETVFNTIREGVIVIDRGLKIHFANRAACDLLGLYGDFVGQRVDRFLRDIEWARLMDADPEQWHRTSLQEIRVCYPVHRYLSFYLVPYRDEEDPERIPMAVILLSDVTAMREDTEKTIESKRVEAITSLAAGVAHEIGNPLNSLTIHLQLLKRAIERTSDDGLAREAEELLDVAVQEVRRLDSITHNFLRAVRPAPPELARLSITKVLASAVGFMRREIEDRHVLVEATWPGRLPMVLGDEAQLRQAFFNLIKNALQAMPDGGVLRIACSERGDYLEIRFADTGKGITPRDMSRILEPYYSTRGGGTGLGLMIVERVVREHGGEIAIDSQAGEGTVFTIRLPVRERRVQLLEDPAIAAASQQDGPPAASGEGIRAVGGDTGQAQASAAVSPASWQAPERGHPFES